MKKGNINIIIVLFTFTLIILFSLFIIYSHISTIVYNIKNDIFYITQNSIISFSIDDLGLKNYSYNKEKIISDIQYILNKQYNNNITKNIVKKIQIDELYFLNKNEYCSSLKFKNDEKIHLKVKVLISPPIFKNVLKDREIMLHEDIKFSLMEI